MFKSFSTAIEHYTQRVTALEKPRLAHEERPTPNLLQQAARPFTDRMRIHCANRDSTLAKAVRRPTRGQGIRLVDRACPRTRSSSPRILSPGYTPPMPSGWRQRPLALGRARTCQDGASAQAAGSACARPPESLDCPPRSRGSRVAGHAVSAHAGARPRRPPQEDLEGQAGGLQGAER